jgi:hypothetical protein
MISLLKINLSRLIGGRYFTILCMVSKNRYRVLFTALINSGVNGFAFISIAYTINITKFFNLKT